VIFGIDDSEIDIDGRPHTLLAAMGVRDPQKLESALATLKREFGLLPNDEVRWNGMPPLTQKIREELSQEFSTRFQPKSILIEDRASGMPLIQELKQEGVQAATSYNPHGLDKVMRLHSVTSTVENGFVYLPEKAEWLASYIHELTIFPHGKRDD
jgi:predicted phage terminase large subunit-like protein